MNLSGKIREIMKMLKADFDEIAKLFGGEATFFQLWENGGLTPEKTIPTETEAVASPESILAFLQEKGFVVHEASARENISQFYQSTDISYSQILKALSQKEEQYKHPKGITAIEIAHQHGTAPRALFWHDSSQTFFLGIYPHKKYTKILNAIRGKERREEVEILARKTGIPVEFFG